MRRQAGAAVAGSACAALALALLAGSASGANGVTGFFGGTGTEGGLFSSASGGPGGVAINQAGSGGASAGDVYVIDRANNRIQQFEANGAWVRAFGKGVGGAGADVCETAASCVAGTASAEAGAMNNPQGVAIDQANGNLYVSDQSNRRIDVFSAQGAFEGAFGWEVDASAPEAKLQLCTTATGCQAGSSGAGAGQFGTQIGYPAVAPAGSPNAGDVYVADKANRRVDQFEPTITSGEVTAVAFVEAWGWGVDDGASEFEQCTTLSECQAPNTSTPTTNPGQFSSSQPQAVAVDSNGDLYTAESSGNDRAQKFDSTGNPAPFSATELSASPGGPHDIAVDPADDHVFALKEVTYTAGEQTRTEQRVLELNSGGALLATHAAGTTITSANGLAVAQGTTDFYVTSNQYASGAQYSGAFFLAAKVDPTATVEAPGSLEAHSATLRGQVNPMGFSTHYRFELSGDGGASWARYPTYETSEENLGDGTADVPVQEELSGLHGGHSYRYRIVATKPFGAGTATSATESFTAPASPPVISEEAVAEAGTGDVVLSAEVNPENEQTTYRVEYGPSASYGLSTPESAPIGAEGDERSHAVSVQIGGLPAGAAYHFRFVATNAAGTGEGADAPFGTYSAPQSFGACPNDRFRTGFGAGLPDCRAYEQATPADKNGADAEGTVGDVAASSNGDRVTFYLNNGLPSSGGSSRIAPFLASRGAGGWSSDGLLPLTAPGSEAKVAGWSEDLSSALVGEAEQNLLSGSAGALYLRDSATAAFEPGPTGLYSIAETRAVGFAADTRHLVFQTSASEVMPEVPGGHDNLYELDHGKLTLAGRVPAGAETSCDDEAGPACVVSPSGSFAGAGEGSVYTEGTISREGSRAFFTTPGEKQVYVREDGERTTRVSAPQRSAPDPSGAKHAVLQAVTPNGSTAFFTSCEKLTEDSTAVSTGSSSCSSTSQGSDLYAYDTGSGRLTDLTVDSNVSDALGADVRGVLGASPDGSYVYFVADGVLAAGASAGDCWRGIGSSCNLYLAHAGTVTFIGRLTQSNGGDQLNWALGNGGGEGKTARVADDGTLLFASTNRLTGYDNAEAGAGDCGRSAGGACAELYRYAPAAEQLNCVSCNPTGMKPKGKASLGSHKPFLHDGPNVPSLSRNLSANGKRVFFQSTDALLPADTNGNSGCAVVSGGRTCQDVYEWEARGEGSCESESQDGGCLYLISSGRSPDPSYFLDASVNGDHAFFFTRQQLVPSDHDELVDVYDAGAGGGLAAQHTLTPPTCAGSACTANPAPPPLQSLASSSFSGPGNAKPAPAKRRCPKGRRRARRNGKVRCLPRHKRHKKRHRRHHKRRHKRHHGKKRHHKRAGAHRAHDKRANVNRGGSR